MKDSVGLGTAPYMEECVQVKTGENYMPAMRQECHQYIELLQKRFGLEPEGASFKIKTYPHDFGSYCDVVVEYDADNETACEFAYHVEDHLPATWKDTETFTFGRK